MPRGSISPNVGLYVDTGNSLLNRSIDGFLRIGIVGAAKAAAEEAYHFTLRRGKISTRNLQHSFKKMCSEGVLWGSVAGVYLGVEYGVAGFRGTRDWKNSMIGGALTGAIVSAVTNSNKEKIVFDAIRGGALATAVLFLHYYT